METPRRVPEVFPHSLPEGTQSIAVPSLSLVLQTGPSHTSGL